MTHAQTTLAWRDHTVAALGVTLALPADGEPSQGAAGGITYLLHDTGPVRIGVWTGPGQDLSGWLARFVQRSPVARDPEPTTLCGQPARRQEIAVAAESATGAFVDPAGDIGHIEHQVPAEIRIAIAGVLPGGAPVLIELAVAAAERDAYRGDERHFFASIRCP